MFGTSGSISPSQNAQGKSIPRFLAHLIVICTVFTPTSLVLAQEAANQLAASTDASVADQRLGISFLKTGQALRPENNGYVLSLENSSGTIRQATASITVSQRPSIDLSGSFGGRLYLDDPQAKPILENVVKVDTVVVHGLFFRREFWAVYAGMGAWECVINCYACHNTQYYSLCLNADVNAGRPGESVGGEKVSTEALRQRVTQLLNDSREPVVQQFNSLLSSFQVSQEKK